jgi:hypothetical protein
MSVSLFENWCYIMEKSRAGIVIGILCLGLALAGIMTLAATPQPDNQARTGLGGIFSPSDPKTIHRNPAYSDTVVSGSDGIDPVELHIEHQKGHVNASGWDEYTISITNPNERDINKDIYLDGTRYNWGSSGWSVDSGFSGERVATLNNITVHPWDTVKVTVPVKLSSTGEKNFYVFKVHSEDA